MSLRLELRSVFYCDEVNLFVTQCCSTEDGSVAVHEFRQEELTAIAIDGEHLTVVGFDKGREYELV